MVLTLIICLLIVIGLKLLRDIIEHKISKKTSGLSFKESLNIADIPIITVENNGKKLNFMLDTGSSSSHINSRILSLLTDYEKIDRGSAGSTEIATANGVKSSTESWINLPFYYKKQYFSEDFLPLDLEEVFKSIKDETGIQIHGILGNSFFTKYNYVLDYEDCTAYIK